MPNQTESPDVTTSINAASDATGQLAKTTADAVESLQAASKLPDMSKVLEAYQAVANVILYATETNPRPSGEIYALLMPSGVPLSFYNKVLEMLVLASRVKVSVGHTVTRLS